MATLVLSAAGGAIGSSIGGGVLGLSSAVIGRAVGATVGQMIDRGIAGAAGQNVLGPGSRVVDHGRLERLRLTSAGEGNVIPRVFGRVRIAGHVIWSTGFSETVVTAGGTGGGKGGATSSQGAVGGKSYRYLISLALGLCEGPIAGIGRIWADGQEIARDTLDLRVHKGREDQLPDSLIEAVEGQGKVPAYRGLAYVLIENLDLAPFGNRVPQFSFEVVRNQSGLSLGDMADHVRAVAMIPGTGEYTLASVPVRYEDEPGRSAFVNAHSHVAGTDFLASLQALNDELPRCEAVSLVVSWFGDDLRCGSCTIRPKTERKGRDGVEMPWRAGGIDAEEASAVPVLEGQSAYGGTPADDAVISSIRALKAVGKDVMFYPFILMDQLDGNGLPDPYGGQEQPALPWRGRITGSVAPGRPGTVDRTAEADREVAAFFGNAKAEDFEIVRRGGRAGIRYNGPREWGLRRFVLHYAHLCKAAGGVESFCIASELRGLTQLRGAAGFPAVAALARLASDVRSILGDSTRIGYAADWSEYFGYHPQDGSGDVYFHLDPLWAHEAIDFIGIDNYMPLSDWRGADGEHDGANGGPHRVDYLKANIGGGEGYDWFYASAEDRAVQRRTPITDGSFGEPWVWRYKDILNWWSNSHHERVGEIRARRPTPWVAQSKPIRFTEIGCPAVNKATNQPNTFVDPKSSESALPYFSDGSRDDFVQVQYLRAIDEYWRDPANNPVSPVYGGQMIDSGRSHVWTWDARPFPLFPALTGTWADGANYYRGHWITGRSGYRTLQSVVVEICVHAGVTRVDASALAGVVRGYSIAEVMTGRAALQPLMMAYGFDAIEREGTLIFRMRKTRPDARLEESDLVQAGAEGGDIVASRDPVAERTGRISIGYICEDGSYSVKTADASAPGAEDGTVTRMELPIILSPDEGRLIAERWMSESMLGRDRLRFGLPPSRSGIGAGDVVSVHGGTYRVDRVEQAEYQMIEASRIGAGQYEAKASEGALGDVTPRIVAPPVLPLLLDLPLTMTGRGRSGLLVGAAAMPWPGEVALHASPEDAGYALGAMIHEAATTGVTEAPLKRAASGQVDRNGVLRVKLLSGELHSCSETRFLAGANTVAVGFSDTVSWEVLQFRDAILVGERTYELRYLLRGQAGTDAVLPETWPVGSRIVVLNDALVPFEGRDVLRGSVLQARIGPAAQALDGPGYQHLEWTISGEWLRPLSPVHLRARRSEGGLAVTWTRRTRVGGDDWSGYDVPLGEENERYLLRILRDGHVLRETVCHEPKWFYTREARLQDGSGYDVEVAQISATYGPGVSAVMRVPDL